MKSYVVVGALVWSFSLGCDSDPEVTEDTSTGPGSLPTSRGSSSGERSPEPPGGDPTPEQTMPDSTTSGDASLDSSGTSGSDSSGDPPPEVGGDPRRGHMASGAWHACILDTDQATRCWGHDKEGRTSPPNGLTFDQLVASHSFSCGIDDPGTLHCWGNPPSVEEHVNVTHAAARVHQICSVSAADDRVECTSRGDRGEPPADYRAVQLAADGGQTCGIGLDGRVTCWGELVLGSPPESLRAVRLAVSTTHACAIDEQGGVECWGGLDEDYPLPDHSARDLAVTDNGTCIVDDAQTLHCFGSSDAGAKVSGAPVDLPAVAVYGNTDTYCVLTDQGVPVCWGVGFGEPEGIADVPADARVLGF